MSYSHAVLQLVLALIIGLGMGFLSKGISRPRGVRVYALICMGATLVTQVSTLFAQSLGFPWTADPSRISAQVVPALSFFGIGMIWLNEENRVHGINSTATLWVTALMGLMLGSGSSRQLVIAFLFVAVVFLVVDRIHLPGRNLYDLLKEIENVDIKKQANERKIKGKMK